MHVKSSTKPSQPQPQPQPSDAQKQSPLQFEDDTVHPLYECAECEHPFRSEVPIDENHCPACRCITHDAQLVVESEELTEVQTYVDGSVKYAKIAGYASGFTAENIEECQQTLDQIDQLIHASPDKMYFIWDNDQDGDGALQYILRQLTSTYSNEYIGFFRIKRDIDPDNLIEGMEHFKVINVVNTTEELSGAPPVIEFMAKLGGLTKWSYMPPISTLNNANSPSSLSVALLLFSALHKMDNPRVKLYCESNIS